MPKTNVIFYCEEDGACPFLEWLDELPQKVKAKCILRVERLAELGHELRRPEADMLRDGIYELRARHGTVNYRILYFFHGRNVAVLAHAITKENEIPVVEINRAVGRKGTFIANPVAHTFTGDIDYA